MSYSPHNVADVRVGDTVRLTLFGPCQVETIDPPARTGGEYVFGCRSLLTGASCEQFLSADRRLDVEVVA